MSDDSKIKDSSESEDIVEDVVEDFTMVQNEKGEEEVIEEEIHVSKVEEVSKRTVNENSEKKPSFIASCAATISDAIIIAVLSYGLLFVVDFILQNVFGLRVVNKDQMLFLLYVIVSLLYVSILESKLGFTVGKTVLGIKVARV